ncbi:MAG: DUF6504 family protein [Brevirhabdus sp.]
MSRRILSLWFPRLAAEHQLRREPMVLDAPLAMVEERSNAQVLASLSVGAEAEGLSPGQPLRDAQAMCPALITRRVNPVREAAFLASLRRWAGKYSPWVAEEAPASLVIDLTGCAHLFGGEAALLNQVEEDCSALGLSVCCGIADTVGAAWALARYAGQHGAPVRSGDAIDQEARATRSRAGKRHWVRGGPAPRLDTGTARQSRIAPPGQARTALAGLPVTALRLQKPAQDTLMRLGLRRIEDLMGIPRAALARRVGQDVVARLDQALGVAPEPVSPAKPEVLFALRLTLPEPIGLEEDLAAALDRLLPPMGAKLKAEGRGARQLRLECHRADGTMQAESVGLARASHAPDRMRPLLRMKLAEIDAGFGIDMVRLVATVTEPVHAHQHRGHLEAAGAARAAMNGDTALDDLIGRLGARVGLEAITRHAPAASHVPEKTAHVLAAAFSEPAADWPTPPTPRPLLLHPPEPIMGTTEEPSVPPSFRWRGQLHQVASARGPERIAPEWWLDDPAWRSGPRDYWQVETTAGARLWLYFAHGSTMSAGWFAQGRFA